MRAGLVSCFYHRDDLENIDIYFAFGYDHVIIDYNLELLREFRQVLLPGGIVLFVRVLP
jgi:SAM-dependent methyltransferase